MIINKTTVGFVTQQFDTETGKWIGQEFHAGDQVDWENEYGEPVDEDEFNGGVPYLPFEMKQPE